MSFHLHLHFVYKAFNSSFFLPLDHLSFFLATGSALNLSLSSVPVKAYVLLRAAAITIVFALLGRLSDLLVRHRMAGGRESLHSHGFVG